MTFTFIGEFGRLELDYKSYLKHPDLPRLIKDPRRAFLNLGSTILSYDRIWLAEHPSEQDLFLQMEEVRNQNPLQFFCPSTLKTSAALDFLNDDDATVAMLIAPNRVGKSTTALIKLILDLIPTDPSWDIFTKHGVKWKPWVGPIEVGVATYQWTMMFDILWPEIRKWLPKAEWDDGKEPSKVATQKVLACGSKINFRCYEQDQQAFESGAYYRWLWDEQAKRNLFDGGDERTRTKRGRHYFALTPHAVEGRPDTGGGSWIEELETGQIDIGVPVKSYVITVDDVPDWVYPEESKKAAKIKWIDEPKRRRDFRMLAEGESRYYGKWHRTQGRLFDQVAEEVHRIDDFKIPNDWTRFRAIDHGLTNPFALICAAVSPPNYIFPTGQSYGEPMLFFYQELLDTAPSVGDIARRIIEACKNRRVRTGSVDAGAVVLSRYEEKVVGQRFFATVMDSRSMAAKDSTGFTLGDLYGTQGLRCQPASGRDDSGAIDFVREYFAPVEGPHPFYPSCNLRPKAYIFRSLTNLWRQIIKYQEKRTKRTDQNRPERADKKDDHLVDATKYMVQIPPRHVEGIWAWDRDDVIQETKLTTDYRRNRFTGY